MTKSISGKIVKNTYFNAAGRFWSILTALLLTPYIIERIGVERYGVWSIVGVFTGYFGLLDFGVRTSFVKYIAEFNAKEDLAGINLVVNTGFVFYSFFAVFISLLAFFVVSPLVTVFDIPADLRAESVFVLTLGIMLFGLSNALSPFSALQTGLQRMDVSTNLAIALSIPNIAGMIFFLERGYGLPGLMVNSAINLGLSGIFNGIAAFRLLPGLRFDPFLFSRAMFAKLFNYGYKLQISNFANLVSFQTDKLLITYFLGVGLVTFYQLGTSILQSVRQLCLILISSLTPAASELEATSGKEALKTLYLRGSKYLIFASIPLTFFVIANASLILAAWMGKGFDRGILVIQILAVGYFAATVTGVASAIAAGVARTDFDMKFGALLSVLNIALGIILAIKIGFTGIVLASAFSLTTASVFYLWMFHGYLGSPMSGFLRLLYKPAVAGLVPAAAMAALNRYFLIDAAQYRRGYCLVSLLAYAAVFAVCYAACIRAQKYFNEEDHAFFRRRLPWIARTLGAGA